MFKNIVSALSIALLLVASVTVRAAEGAEGSGSGTGGAGAGAGGAGAAATCRVQSASDSAAGRWQRRGMHGRSAPRLPASYMQLSHHLDADCEQPACSLHAVHVQLERSLHAACIRPTRNLHATAMVNMQIRRMLLALCNTQIIKNSFKMQGNTMLLLICLKRTSRSVPQGEGGDN